MKKNTRIILAVLGVILLVGVAIWVCFAHRPKHTVSDFAFYPCPFVQADRIEISAPSREMTFAKSGTAWEMIQPFRENLNFDAESELQRFLVSKMFIDEKREVTPEERAKLSSESPTKVSFYNQDKVLCSFELGRGYKLPTVDSERRWLFPEGSNLAYRTFVPLQDFGELFEQPPTYWRQMVMLSIATSFVEELEIWTRNESFLLDKRGVKSAKNPNGWQLKSAHSELDEIDVEHFDLDVVRVSTVVDLVTPFYIDDWADGLSSEEVEAMNFGGRLTIGLPGKKEIFYIGPEVDSSKYPQWAHLGKGARFIKMEGLERLGIISSMRLMGIFPALDDMRTKNVWKVDSSHLSRIEIQVMETCLSYVPATSQQWQAQPCDQVQGEGQLISPTELGTFSKALVGLQAVRYVSLEEKPEVAMKLTQPAAEIRLFFDHESEFSMKLELSETIKGMYRYARVWSRERGNGPGFVLTEGISHLLLSDLREEI